MTRLLHLDSSVSPAGESISRELTALFAKHCAAEEYTYRDLAADPVPMIGSAYVALGQRLEREGLAPVHAVSSRLRSVAEQGEWDLTYPLITELLAADVVVIGAPMYNFSVPVTLKSWIDRINFPGALIEPETRKKLLQDTRFVVITTRGGGYGPGMPREGLDFQEPYLRGFLGTIGVTDPAFVNAELTLATWVPHLKEYATLAEESLEAARAAVVSLATSI